LLIAAAKLKQKTKQKNTPYLIVYMCVWYRKSYLDDIQQDVSIEDVYRYIMYNIIPQDMAWRNVGLGECFQIPSRLMISLDIFDVCFI